MRVLVVGGAGYIGSAIVEQLLAAGHQVTVLDSLVSGHLAAVHPDAELVLADDRDGEALERLFSTRQMEAVVYCGGYSLVGESMRQPHRYFANNVGGPLSLLNAMLARDVRLFLYSSSAAVYGQPETTPTSEEAPLRPISAYGESKAMVERVLPWYAQGLGLRYTILRCFSVAGASERLGEDHRPETHLIPLLLQVALGQRPVLPLHGTDCPTPDGTCIRDYVHVLDVARGYVLALEKLARSPSSAVYNLGSGRGFSNRQVIEAARRVTGKPIPVREGPRRPGDPATVLASIQRARGQLGWNPRITDLEEIIESAWLWQQAHPQGYGQ